jgi:SAM-dependent methyltransferase
VDFAPFDKRNYPVVSVQDGYGEWADTYEATVLDLMDLRLLARLKGVDWPAVRYAADFACGTGRIGAWLTSRGVQAVDGIDLTPQMLEKAKARGIYRTLKQGNLAATGFDSRAYDLVTEVLAEEHLPDLAPLYLEAARLCRDDGHFVIVGFHPFFLMQGIPTHFNRASGDSLTIRSYVHLMSDHVRAAHAAGFTLAEMDEGLVDDDWIARKPKWDAWRHRPVSFALVWARR